MANLKKNLFQFIKNHKNVQISDQAIRNAISNIRSKNPGLTLNAAASIFAQKKRFKVNRFLNEEDRKALQNIRVESEKTSQPKINKKIRFKPIDPPYGKDFIIAANNNAMAYPYVYILENSLRKLILDTFSSEKNWWEKKATTDAKNHAVMIQNAEQKHDWLPKRGKHPIYYIGLDDLFGIIARNYITNFKTIFKDQGNLRTWINEVLPIRNLIAHNVEISKDEVDNLKIRTKYICTIIENNRILPIHK
jgi:hypothetical protein